MCRGSGLSGSDRPIPANSKPGYFSPIDIVTAYDYIRPMKITVARLPDPLREELDREVERSGISMSEIIRRAVDEHLERRQKRAKRRHVKTVSASSE
jgi:hypothetical protein